MSKFRTHIGVILALVLAISPVAVYSATAATGGPKDAVITLQVALTQLKPLYGLDYSLQMGGAFLATAPLLILFIFVGRRLVSGVMDGAVKG